MDVRRLALADLEALLVLYQQLHPADEPLPGRAEVERTWRDILASPLLHYFGGFEGDVLVATCNLTIVPNLTRGGRPFGVIENVVTHEAHRRRGHGRALLAHALGHAWEAGCYKVMLQTGRKDEATMRFYEAAGFDRFDKQAFVARPGR